MGRIYLFLVLLLVLLFPLQAIADSCPCCGQSYGAAAPGDEARVNALRAAHEASCCGRQGTTYESTVDWQAEQRRQQQEQQERQKQRDKSAEGTFRPIVDKWGKQAADDAKQDQDAQLQMRTQQQGRLAQSRNASYMMNNWNDQGVAAYQNDNWGRAIQYFRHAQHYAPDNQNIEHNIEKSRNKAREEAESYLSSVKTALGVASLSPRIMLLHPDPYIRMEAQKQLVKETMEAISMAAATFVLNEHLSQKRIQRFNWESEAERQARKNEAIRHANTVENLQQEAMAEVAAKAQALDLTGLSASEQIRIQNGRAMSQLIQLSFDGFD